MTDRISLLIKAKNLSSAQFADEIGVQRSSISHLMSGRNKPSLDLIQKTLQRFPEVSTEWLLFGKGEMVPEMNLFNSQVRFGKNESDERLALEEESLQSGREKEPFSKSAADQASDINMPAQEGKEAIAEMEQRHEGMAKPSAQPAENAKNIIEARKESPEDTGRVKSQPDGKKGSAIDQIIVFYDDRTFIAYSPGN
jgi:transcriptional regulator with XRE-family HTH domain